MKIIVTNPNERLDKYLASNTEYSRNIIAKMLDKELITVNNKSSKGIIKYFFILSPRKDYIILLIIKK